MVTAKNRDQLVPRARVARGLPSGPSATRVPVRNQKYERGQEIPKNNEVDDGDANSLRRSLCWAMDGLR
jgi:hypothetical protein